MKPEVGTMWRAIGGFQYGKVIANTDGYNLVTWQIGDLSPVDIPLTRFLEFYERRVEDGQGAAAETIY